MGITNLICRAVRGRPSKLVLSCCVFRLSVCDAVLAYLFTASPSGYNVACECVVSNIYILNKWMMCVRKKKIPNNKAFCFCKWCRFYTYFLNVFFRLFMPLLIGQCNGEGSVGLKPGSPELWRWSLAH